MKVVLKQDVKSIGKKDELHEVSDGYARNYLLPRGLAVAADAAAVNEGRTKAAASEHHAAEELANAQALAKKLAGQAVRTGKSVSLEPMNPYERRIIHSAVQQVAGATSKSIGEEPNRRVIISSTVAPQRRSRPPRSSAPRATAVQTPEATVFEVQEGSREGAMARERRGGSRPPRQGGRSGGNK